jgi:hypothetical protein
MERSQKADLTTQSFSKDQEKTREHIKQENYQEVLGDAEYGAGKH